MKGRPRHSLQRAEATGATKHNPARYKTRKPPTLPPLGRAPAHMSEAERRCWTAFKRELALAVAAPPTRVGPPPLRATRVDPMPVKSRRSKRRNLTSQAELEAWSMAFEPGHDYLGDIVIDGQHPYWVTPIPRDVLEAQWRRMGAAYLARRPPPRDGRTPYALEHSETRRAGSAVSASTCPVTAEARPGRPTLHLTAPQALGAKPA